jgi:hydroxymethylglutaryl-CoA synthase
MTGIERVGVHIPRLRLSRNAISAVWGSRERAGTRAVANWDEDALSMAVQAAESCLQDVNRNTIDMIIVASTTLPYAEKQAAAIAAEALDLRTDVETLDVGSSLRAGTQALKLGLNILQAGGQRVLVACADTRLTRAGSRAEEDFGDAAVAFLLGPNTMVHLEPLTTRPSTAVHYWRLPGEQFVRQSDERFGSKIVYQGEIKAAIRVAMVNGDLLADDVTFAAIAGPNYAAVREAANESGIEVGKLAGEAVYDNVGHCGVATGPLCLVAALERAGPGVKVLLVDHGDGVDVMLATTAAAVCQRNALATELAGGIPITYEQFLKFKGLLEAETVNPYTSEIALWRDSRYQIRLHAPRCDKCGAIQYPPRRVCWLCRNKDEFTEVRLARDGHLCTFTVEHLFPVPEGHLITAVVDLSDGARLYTQMVDCRPEEVTIGMPVRLAFRRLHQGKGLHHYFWKAVPH